MRVDYQFSHLGLVFKGWAESQGLSQAAIAQRGGPSKPKQTELATGKWSSSRPSEMTAKIDQAFGWPDGTAWRVLTEGYDPLSDPSFVGGVGQGEPGYVSSSVRERVEGGKQNDEVLRAIASMSAAVDQLVVGQRDLAERVDAGHRSLSERLDALEAQHDARLAALEARD